MFLIISPSVTFDGNFLYSLLLWPFPKLCGNYSLQIFDLNSLIVVSVTHKYLILLFSEQLVFFCKI